MVFGPVFSGKDQKKLKLTNGITSSYKIFAWWWKPSTKRKGKANYWMGEDTCKSYSFLKVIVFLCFHVPSSITLPPSLAFPSLSLSVQTHPPRFSCEATSYKSHFQTPVVLCFFKNHRARCILLHFIVFICRSYFPDMVGNFLKVSTNVLFTALATTLVIICHFRGS